MTLDTLKKEHRLTEDEYIALRYLKGKVEKYIWELEEHNPEYLADLRCRCTADFTNKREMSWLQFEVQELAEDITGVVFDEEEELKRYYGARKDKDENEGTKISFILQRLLQCEIEHQLLNKERFLFDLIPLSTKHGHSIITILAKLGRNNRTS